jgi:hypothetical protein
MGQNMLIGARKGVVSPWNFQIIINVFLFWHLKLC